MKPILLMQGPIATRSGYGDHMRDLAKSIIKFYDDKYDIRILSLRWGDTPMNGLDEKNPEDNEIIKRILKTPQLPKKPAVFIQVSVPNEFQPIGDYNIGITAGIETTVCSVEWIEGCNRMDLIIVPSTHSANVFRSIAYDKVDNQTKNVVGKVQLQKPIEVLFEGLDKKVFKKSDTIVQTLKDELDNVIESFNYLFVGHWLNGKPGHDRKDIGTLITTFCKTFYGKTKKPGLILKTSGATFSIIDRNEMLKKIKKIRDKVGPNSPNVYLLHGDLEPEEMNSLYNHPKVKAMVSFTKGEGFGRPLLEFSTTGKPIIASNFSGQTDFLKHAVMLPGELKNVHKSAAWDKVLLKESKWFYVNENYASKQLREMFKHYKKYLPMSREQAKFVNANFTMEKMDELLKIMFDKYIPEPTQMVKLNLPKLNIKNTKSQEVPKIKLPKLKKVE
mgnify:CR=1 FL=1